MSFPDGKPPGDDGNGRGLRYLSPHQVVMIDEALRSVGDYGEVRLVVSKSKLRFIVTQKSYDALKWEFGQNETCNLRPASCLSAESGPSLGHQPRRPASFS